MFFSRMKAPALHRVTVSRFGGLDLRDRPAENAFAPSLPSPGAVSAAVRHGRRSLRRRRWTRFFARR